MLHEFWHFVTRNFSDPSPMGGAHDGSQAAPQLAWNEGVATFFGQWVLGTSLYTDWVQGGTVSKFNLENIAGSQGTSDGTMTGLVSEFLVSMVLWDLADPANESFDKFNSEIAGVIDAVFNYFPGASFHDRGVSGKDLVDMLDGWRCKGHGRDADMKTLLDSQQFPYDFATLASCR
jgi:hypothetical protein